MIKAYLYPQWLFGKVDNDIFDEDQACRVEVNLLGVPKDGRMIYDPTYDNGVAQALFESCNKQLLDMKSIISRVLEKFRDDLKKSEEEELNNKANLSNIELLKQLIFQTGSDNVGAFSEGLWFVESVHILANDDHLHIRINQEA